MTAPDPQAIRDAADRAEQLRADATPGPWESRTFSGDVVRVNNGPPTLVADYYGRSDKAQAEADAALIAATPELLSVLVPAARTAADLQPVIDFVQEFLQAVDCSMDNDEVIEAVRVFLPAVQQFVSAYAADAAAAAREEG